MASKFIVNGRSFPGANREFVIAEKTFSSMPAILADARNSYGYSSFDKSSSASGIGILAVTVVPP
jgi:hypothetical protein